MALDPVALNRTAAWLARLAAVAAAALVVTGVPLIWLYRPAGSGRWLTTLHSMASSLFLGSAAAMLVLGLAVALARHPPWAGWIVTLGVLVVAVAGSFTGQLIAWDQVGLWAVTVATSFRGMIDPLGDDVRFLIIGDAEVSQGSYLAWLLVHLLAVPAAAVAVGLPLWRRLRADEHDTGPADAAAAGAADEFPAGGNLDAGS
jgi:quinol-cytochrome oxidoreductase complex cytochrome b subunit